MRPKDFFRVETDEEGRTWTDTGHWRGLCYSPVTARPAEEAVLIPVTYRAKPKDAFTFTHAGWTLSSVELVWAQPATGWKWADDTESEAEISITYWDGFGAIQSRKLFAKKTFRKEAGKMATLYIERCDCGDIVRHNVGGNYHERFLITSPNAPAIGWNTRESMTLEDGGILFEKDGEYTYVNRRDYHTYEEYDEAVTELYADGWNAVQAAAYFYEVLYEEVMNIVQSNPDKYEVEEW